MKYICMNCKIFIYDEEKGDSKLNLNPHTNVENIPDSYRCPICGALKCCLHQLNDDKISLKNDEKGVVDKDLNYYRDEGRNLLTGLCGVYPVCDGDPDHTCTGQKYGAPIGMGGAGQAKTFEANYKALQQFRLKMKVIKSHKEPEISTSIFGKKLKAPFMGAPLSGAKPSLNDIISEEDLYWGLLKGAQLFGTIGNVGNTPSTSEKLGVTIIGKNKGWGIPFFKPQSQDRLIKLFQLAEKLDVIAIGVDLGGVGSTYWAHNKKRVYRKSEDDLQELVDCTGKPVIFKDIMSPDDAMKVVDSGADACYVSNHGGRVLDCGQGVAEVLPDIAEEISGKILIFADGTVRTGFDVLKILALGADVALIGRPLAQVCVSGGYEAVKMYFNYVLDDLRRAMILTGCDKLEDAKMNILTV
ncbi:MAG: alpha-hydroxy-acid oxidizing protein [Methanobacterium sp.]|nr:alpha-hydroxy-acid oxidizing protein [Methanobacterium sp.]